MSQARHSKGSPQGGQFASKGGGGGGGLALGGGPPVVKDIKLPNKQKEARTKQAEESVDRSRKLLGDLGIDVSDVNVTLSDRMPRGIAADAIGFSDRYSKNVTMNVGTRYYARVYDNQKELGKSGMHSTGNKDHAVVHELSHQLHRKSLRQGEKDLEGVSLQDRKTTVDGATIYRQAPRSEDSWDWQAGDMHKGALMRKTARKVSRYAAENPHEFVAETFTKGAITGAKFPADVQSLYIQAGGPHPEIVFRGGTE